MSIIVTLTTTCQALATKSIDGHLHYKKSGDFNVFNDFVTMESASVTDTLTSVVGGKWYRYIPTVVVTRASLPLAVF